MVRGNGVSFGLPPKKAGRIESRDRDGGGVVVLVEMVRENSWRTRRGGEPQRRGGGVRTWRSNWRV